MSCARTASVATKDKKPYQEYYDKESITLLYSRFGDELRKYDHGF